MPHAFPPDTANQHHEQIAFATGHAITRSRAAHEESEDVPQDNEGTALPYSDAKEVAGMGAIRRLPVVHANQFPAKFIRAAS